MESRERVRQDVEAQLTSAAAKETTVRLRYRQNLSVPRHMHACI